MTLDRNEMLKRLALGDKLKDRTAPVVRPEASKVQAGALQRPGTNPYALKHDPWTRRRGEEIARQQGGSRRYANGIRQDMDQFTSDVTDFYGACFSNKPTLTTDSADVFKASFIKELLNSGAHKGTRVQTVSRDAESAVATGAIIDAFNKAIERGRKPGTAADQAANAASDAVDELKETEAAFGRKPGRQDGADKGMTGDDALRLYEKIRNNQTLRTIVEMAGRLRRFGMAKQRRKTSHGSEDLVGIGLGGIEELSRLVPSEMMNMIIPELQLDTLRRLVEKQALVKKMVNYEPVGKGPVIGIFDESLSMAGTPSHQCKALALAMAWIAKQQGRWCALIGFSSSYQRRTLVLPPGQWSDDKIITWLLGFFGGGTSPPVSDLPEIYRQIGAPEGKTDVVYVTDGEVGISPMAAEAFNTWRKDPKVKAHVTTLLIGTGAGGLADISDETHLVSKIDVDQEGVGAALSF